MFSLRLSEHRSDAARSQGLGRGLLGRVFGCVLGLVLIVALDAYVLNHTIQQNIMRNDWGLTRAAQNFVASVHW